MSALFFQNILNYGYLKASKLKNLLVCTFILFFLLSQNHCISQTLPPDQRPDWMKKEGLVMAGNWEPLTYRTREGTRDGHSPTNQEIAEWEFAHDSLTTARLKELGVNFIMMHCYKGAGLNIEQKTMNDAVRFARSYHDAGLHVGVYVYSGAFLWEPFFREVPEANNWILLDENYKPYDYYQMGIRYFWDRNHPGAQEFYKGIIKFAVDSIKADLLHFDNFGKGPGRDANSTDRFHDYLRKNFTISELQIMNAEDLSKVIPPMNNTPQNLLDYAWTEFSTQSVADAYFDMNKYARSLRPDILLEMNCGGAADFIRAPKDHGRILQGGEALWSEGTPSGFIDGKFHNRIQTYKIARSMNNMVFFYANSPVSASESMAFNNDCFGMITEFKKGEIISPRPPKGPVNEEIIPYVRFYKSRRELFNNSEIIADVAIYRNFPSQVFSDPSNRMMTSDIEQLCIYERIPFQIVYQHQLHSLEKHKVLVLAGCEALSDEDISLISRFVDKGGNLLIIGKAGIYDEWMFERKVIPFTDLPDNQVFYLKDNEDTLTCLRKSCMDNFSFTSSGQKGLFAEYTENKDFNLVHLVNFRPEIPVKKSTICMEIPEGKQVKSVQIASPTQKTDQNQKFKIKNNRIYFDITDISVYKIGIIYFN